MKCILIVDTDPSVQKNFSDLLSDQNDLIRVLSTSDVHKALKTIEMFKIDVVITTIRAKALEGLKIIEFLKRKATDIKTIVVIDKNLPKIDTKLKKLGITDPLVEPIEADKLRSRLFKELDVAYGGQIHGISLSSFLQMLELEGKTCSLKITAGEKKGYIYLENGALLTAETAADRGKPAALKILAWEDILIDINYAPPKKKKEIGSQLMALLLESKQQQDENGHHPSDKRKQVRVGCLIAADIDIDDWSYKSFIRNLSLEGAFIETDQTISLGQKLSLSLSLRNPKQVCRISGKTVRRDSRGVGVQFDPLSMRQRNILESIILPKKDKIGL